MLGPYKIQMLNAWLSRGAGQEEALRVASELNSSTKDKSKLAKNKYMGAGMRYHTGFTNTLDDNSRPVVTSSGHVYYFADELVQEYAKKATGLFYEGALFESNATASLNRVSQNLTETKVTTSFTGRTAYLGQNGIKNLLDNNIEKVLAQNNVYYNTKEQKHI